MIAKGTYNACTNALLTLLLYTPAFVSRIPNENSTTVASSLCLFMFGCLLCLCFLNVSFFFFIFNFLSLSFFMFSTVSLLLIHTPRLRCLKFNPPCLDPIYKNIFVSVRRYISWISRSKLERSKFWEMARSRCFISRENACVLRKFKFSKTERASDSKYVFVSMDETCTRIINCNVVFASIFSEARC